MNRLIAACLRALLGCAVVACCWTDARSADNAATGGIGGLSNGTLLGGDGTGDARVSLFSADLGLVKKARALDGTVLPDLAQVNPGQEIWFELSVDNPTAAPVTDLQLEDLLDEAQFAYVPGTLAHVLVASGASDAAVWSASWNALTDALGPPDDVASMMNSGGPPGPDRLTAGAQAPQINQTLTVPANGKRAIRFRVRVL